MKVSVIIPIYNKEGTLGRALESVAAQTFSEFECLLVDDGSRDGSAAIAEGFRDSRFRLIRQANAGPGAARNRGIAEAAGGLLAFLDADDEWLPDYLQRAVGLLEGAGPAVAAATFAWYDQPGDRSTVGMWRRRGVRNGAHRVTPQTPAAVLAHMLGFMSPCSTVARAAMVRRYGGFYARNHCRFGEDSYLWLKILLNEPVVFRLEPLVNVNRGAASLSGNYRGPRPVEPFLEDPGDVRAVCPSPLADLLEQFFAIRAMKTACMLGYWGQWREAAALRRRFRHPRAWRLPWFLPSLVASTPAAAVLAAGLRKLGV